MKSCITLLTIVLVALLASSLPAAEPKRPNVIVFLVDDMGWMDSGVYGSRYYETPNIDALAARGMLFTNAYSANPLCSPTRASILTGKYPARHGITTASGHQPPHDPGEPLIADTAPPTQAFITPRSRNYLDPSEYTLAEAFRDAGYRTAHIGKWHLGLTEPHWPEQQGFEFAFHGKPDPGPGSSYFAPYQFRAYRSFEDGPPGEYIVDRVTDEAINFIQARVYGNDSGTRPFYLSVWQYGVHGPWGHKEEYTREFAKKKDPTGRQGNPIMASMLRSVDQSVGRIVAELDRLKLADNTIFLFTSDNGGNVHSNLPGDKREKNTEAIKDWRKWAGNLPPTNNSPLRGGKSMLYEGGIRVPLIVAWPGKIAAGTRTETIACSIDFYPTLMELTGVSPKQKTKFDGISLAPVLLGKGEVARDTIFNYFPHGGPTKPPGAVVRQGDFKLIRWFETSRQFPQKHELYNLREDIGETKNLAAQMPEKVKQLDALIDQFLRDTEALAPRPNPAYDPNAVERRERRTKKAA